MRPSDSEGVSHTSLSRNHPQARGGAQQGKTPVLRKLAVIQSKLDFSQFGDDGVPFGFSHLRERSMYAQLAGGSVTADAAANQTREKNSTPLEVVGRSILVRRLTAA